MTVQLDVLLPLGRRHDLAGVVEVAEGLLKGEADSLFKKLLMGGVASILHAHGWEEQSLDWCRRAIAEFPDDPVVHNALATRYLINTSREPTADDLDKALVHSALAVEKARASNTWRRYVLHDRCRIAAAANRYDLVAEAMAEILDVWAHPCDPDISAFEADWLDGLPPNAIEPELLEGYREASRRQRPTPT